MLDLVGYELYWDLLIP